LPSKIRWEPFIAFLSVLQRLPYHPESFARFQPLLLQLLYQPVLRLQPLYQLLSHPLSYPPSLLHSLDQRP
jgi:hypothetical protein